MKGVSLIFEQVLLFMIGVSIFMAMFYSFTSYQNHYMSVGASDQIDQVKNLIAANIMEVSNLPLDAVSTRTINIPGSVSGEYYKIILSSGGLNISTYDGKITRSLPLGGINETYNLSGETTSKSLKIVIYKTADRIIIQ